MPSGFGLAFGGAGPTSQSQTVVAGRDHQGLSKAERLLGVSDTAGLPHNGTTEWRPRQRKLRNMGSNLSLLTDIKKVISGSSTPRSASRARHTPIEYAPSEPQRPRTRGLRLQTDQRSVRSDVGEHERSPLSAGTLPSYYYKHSPASLVDTSDIPRVPELPAHEKPKMGKYTQAEQDKIMSNLVSNGMMTTGEKRSRDKRPRTGKGQDGRSTSQKHSRGNSGASKTSATASSKYSQDQDGSRYSQGRKGSGSSAIQPADDTSQLRSARKSSQILSPQLASRAPGIRISRIDSPEGERIRTWLTYTDTSLDAAANPRPDWLAAPKLETLQEAHSTNSVRTMTSLETGTLFPIQGGPDDWSTIKRHSRQSSVLMRSETPTGGQGKITAATKGGKVYYTDLQMESVLALSSSDSESDAESEASALARRRMSLLSNGADTQPTAWSSTGSSRSQSRKMSMNTYATSPQRQSFSSDSWNYPLPHAHAAVLSREPSTSQEKGHQPRQPSPMRHEVDGVDLSDYPPPTEEDLLSPTDQGPPSSPTLSPREPHGPQLARMTLIAQEDTPNPLLEAIRGEGRVRKNSSASQSKLPATILDLASSPAQPAPTKPLPMPPIQTSALSTPTIQTPSGDDDNSSIFSFPKPPRVLKKGGTRSGDPNSPASEPTTPGGVQNSTPQSADSDGSTDTVRPSMKRKPSNLSIVGANEAAADTVPEKSNFLSPDAAHGNSPYVLEEFSPIVLGFPDHVHRDMDDASASKRNTVTISQNDAAAPGTAVSTNDELPSVAEEFPALTPTEPEPQPLELEIPQTGTVQLIPPYAGPRSAPLAIKTDLSPVAEGSPASGGIQTAPPSVQTHWEKAMAANFPSIPLAQASQRPMRRFHLPTNSTVSTTMTARNSPSPRMRDSDFGDSARVAVGPGIPVAIGVATTRGERSASVGRGHMRTPTGSGSTGGYSGRGTPPPSTTATRGYRTSKRISTGKGIEPLRLSRIGNAV